MKQLLIAVAVILLAACSDPSDPPEPVAVPPAPAATAAASHQATPFDPLLKSADKARNVENVLHKADQQRREAIDNAGG